MLCHKPFSWRNKPSETSECIFKGQRVTPQNNLHSPLQYFRKNWKYRLVSTCSWGLARSQEIMHTGKMTRGVPWWLILCHATVFRHCCLHFTDNTHLYRQEEDKCWIKICLRLDLFFLVCKQYTPEEHNNIIEQMLFFRRTCSLIRQYVMGKLLPWGILGDFFYVALGRKPYLAWEVVLWSSCVKHSY